MNNVVEKLAQGELARAGLLSQGNLLAASELMARVDKSSLETIRVLFADQHGVLRGKTIVASAFPSVFLKGIAVPSTLLLKDTSQRTVFPVWEDSGSSSVDIVRGAGDILLLPDASSFRTLPWSPHSAWILCDVVYTSGTPISFAPRTVLNKTLAQLARHDISLLVGLELEFHVFETVDPQLDHAAATMPGKPPLTRNLAQGYQLLSASRYGELEHIMDELRRNCQALHLPVRSMEVEFGPSQFEFTFDYGNALEQADNVMMFRTMVKEVCARRSLHATFMCRPKLGNGAASGWHLHQSLVNGSSGENLMTPGTDDTLAPLASQWIGGLLSHASESCVLTTPTVNGYKRYQSYQLAPDRIQWGRDNRGAMIRGLMRQGDKSSRIENRVAEPAANPYYFFASQILSGLSGIDSNIQAPAAVESPYDNNARRLPVTLMAAITEFESSRLYREQLGDEFVDYLAHIKRAEWDRYMATVSEWEQAEYFSQF